MNDTEYKQRCVDSRGGVMNVYQYPYCDVCETEKFHTPYDYCALCSKCIKGSAIAETSLIDIPSTGHHDTVCGECITRQLEVKGIYI